MELSQFQSGTECVKMVAVEGSFRNQTEEVRYTMVLRECSHFSRVLHAGSRGDEGLLCKSNSVFPEPGNELYIKLLDMSARLPIFAGVSFAYLLGVVLAWRTLAVTVSDQEILEMIFFPVINEACRVMEEGVIIRASYQLMLAAADNYAASMMLMQRWRGRLRILLWNGSSNKKS